MALEELTTFRLLFNNNKNIVLAALIISTTGVDSVKKISSFIFIGWQK